MVRLPPAYPLLARRDRRDLVGGAGRSRAGARQILAGEFRAKEWEMTSWRRADLAVRARQHPRGARCARGAPVVAGWPHGKRLISSGAHDVSGLLRLVLGGHIRDPWAAAPPLCTTTTPPNPRVARGFFPERGRPARSGFAPATTHKNLSAMGSVLPLWPGRPRSLGCGSAALRSECLGGLFGICDCIYPAQPH